VLVDTHWIGGDPGKLEVYGYASWNACKGVVMLRNPDDQPRPFALDIGTAFELPAGAPIRYSLKSPWGEDASKAALIVEAGKPVSIQLKPFEVIVLMATPVAEGATLEPLRSDCQFADSSSFPDGTCSQ
jgi:hypothetical protein